MDIADFMPSKRRTFEIKSGKVIVADPFELGFPNLFLEQLRRVGYGGSASRKFPKLDFLPAGVMLTGREDGGAWNLYREGDTLRLVDPKRDPVGWFGYQIPGKQPEGEPGGKAFTVLDELRQREPQTSALFGVSHNYYHLLIGDAARFTLPPSERVVLYSDTRVPLDEPDEERRGRVLAMLEREMNENNEQIVEVSNGEYRCTVANRVVLVRPTKK